MLLASLLGCTHSSVLAQQTASANLFNDLKNDEEKSSPVRVREKSTDYGFSTSDFLPPGERKNIAPEIESKVECRVAINVPRNIDSRNTFTFYPYPMKPPKIKTAVKGLAEDPKDIKAMLINTGYVNRTNVSSAYPYGGWRWQYAFQAAMRKAGTDFPHVLPEIYVWADDLMPYVVAECKRSNKAEKDRQQRYMRAQNDYEETRVDIENDALRKGLFPVDVRFSKYGDNQVRWGTAKMLPGTWWLTGTHKAAGLTYYWSMPIEIEEGSPRTISLTEANALVIEGGW